MNTIKIKPNRNKIFIERQESSYLYRGSILTPEIHTFRECLGVIHKINPESNLAKEGYTVGQKVIFRQQFVGQVLDEKFPDVLIVDDESIVGKYVINKKDELIIIPRKGWLFGEYIREENFGSIIMFGGSKKSSYEYYLKIISMPLTYKHKTVYGGDMMPLIKSHPPKCLILNYNNKPHVFVPEDCVLAKVQYQQEQVSLLHLP